MKKKQDKDQAILNTARLAFLQFGVAGTTMDRIAKESGVSKATLYKYYPSKDALFTKLIQSMFESFSSSPKYNYDPNASIETMLQNILTAKFAMLTSSQTMDLLRILSIEFIKKYPFDPQIIQTVATGHDGFIDWVKQCQEDHKLSNDYTAKEIATWFLSLYDGMVMWPVIMNLKPIPNALEQNTYRAIISKSFLELFLKT